MAVAEVTEVVVVGDAFWVPGRVGAVEPCSVNCRAVFASTSVVTVFAVVVEFLYEVERTLT